jgi:hypothetical protein
MENLERPLAAFDSGRLQPENRTGRGLGRLRRTAQIAIRIEDESAGGVIGVKIVERG